MARHIIRYTDRRTTAGHTGLDRYKVALLLTDRELAIVRTAVQTSKRAAQRLIEALEAQAGNPLLDEAGHRAYVLSASDAVAVDTALVDAVAHAPTTRHKQRIIAVRRRLQLRRAC